MSYKDDHRSVPVGTHTYSTSGTGWFPLGLALSVAAVFLCAVAIWPQQAATFNQEGGLIETLSAAALFMAGLVALIRYRGLARMYIGLVCLLLAERELEADIYAENSLPFMVLNSFDTILDLTAVRVALALVVIGGAVWHGIPDAWRAIKLRAPFMLVFLGAGSVAVIAQLLEEVSGFFEASLSVTMAARLFALEETLEMYFSVGILAAVLIGWPKSKTEETANDLHRKPDAR